jgi:hypothetical protein
MRLPPSAPRGVTPPPFAPGADVPSWAMRYTAGDYPPFGYTSDILGFALDTESTDLMALVVERGADGPFAGLPAWPGGFVDWARDADARAAGLRELGEETSDRAPAYLEPLDTYDALGRDPRQWAGTVDPTGGWTSRGARIVSKAFLALLTDLGPRPAPRPGEDNVAAEWVPVRRFLPWEDLRSDDGRTAALTLATRLRTWSRRSATAEPRREAAQRIDYAFGGAELEAWNEERVPERFALLMEAGLLAEAHRDQWGRATPMRTPATGIAMAFDHRLMLADALGRLRGKIKYRPALLAALRPGPFTLTALSAAVEAVGGRRLHGPNFRRVVSQTDAYTIVEPVSSPAPVRSGPKAGRRPTYYYRFPADVALRRLDPGIRLPWVP